jgi:co-chaperonin GroES (HSP10)
MRDLDPKTVQPLGNRVLIEEDPKPTRSDGGEIILPDTARDAKFCTGATVLAVGSGRRLKKSDKVVPIELKPGDRVVLAKAHGTIIQERIRMVDYDVIEGAYEEDAAE